MSKTCRWHGIMRSIVTRNVAGLSRSGLPAARTASAHGASTDSRRPGGRAIEPVPAPVGELPLAQQAVPHGRRKYDALYEQLKHLVRRERRVIQAVNCQAAAVDQVQSRDAVDLDHL